MVLNAIIRTNGKTSMEYIINAFNYKLKETTSKWFHNYMLKFLNYSFFELTKMFCKHRRKMQNDEHIYMKLKIPNKEKLSM
jgi:hypothetical protein